MLHCFREVKCHLGDTPEIYYQDNNVIEMYSHTYNLMVSASMLYYVSISSFPGGTEFRIFNSDIDGLHLFRFSRKIAHAHISGRQNKNKLKEKHAESSEQLVNRNPTSIYTSFVSVDFEKNMPHSCAAFGCTNRRSTNSLQFHGIPSANDILSKELQNGSLLKMTG